MADSPEPAQARSLGKVLGRSKRVKQLVAESAQELSSANAEIKEELGDVAAGDRLDEALEKSAAVEEKVHEASEELSAVNDELEGEVRDRAMLDHKLAAAVEQTEAARHSALHDPLTGLANRALFNDRLEHGLAQAKRHGWTLAVMFLDLDNFKSINDGYGHDVGDSVLRTIATRLTDNTREDDTVSRHGGDEFLYLMVNVSTDEQTLLVARKIVEAVQAPCLLDMCKPEVRVTIRASLGIALYPRNGSTASELITSADAAMYQSKRTRVDYSFAT